MLRSTVKIKSVSAFSLAYRVSTFPLCYCFALISYRKNQFSPYTRLTRMMRSDDKRAPTATITPAGRSVHASHHRRYYYVQMLGDQGKLKSVLGQHVIKADLSVMNANNTYCGTRAYIDYESPCSPPLPAWLYSVDIELFIFIIRPRFFRAKIRNVRFTVY